MISSDFFKKAERLLQDNSPLVLSAIGVSGTLTTAYLAGKASWEAHKRIDHAETWDLENDGDILSTKERVKLVWQLYIPASTTAVLTVSCIVCANRIGTRRAAAMAAAFSVSEKTMEEYRAKVVEKLGSNKEQAVRDEIAQERVTRTRPTNSEVIIINSGDVLCYDKWSGRYFQSQMETLRKAQNDVNEEIIHNMYVTLGEFYDMIGLAATPMSEQVGWNSEHLLHLQFSTVLSEDNRPCIVIDYRVQPTREYLNLHL